MAPKWAVCPDGTPRAYTVEGEIAIVEVRGSRIEGKQTGEDGVVRFRPSARHHGAHLMWYPPPEVAKETPG
jgi:hypothetical protein